ncbi:hypothetical protein [Acinetobacter sp. RF14B]|uniref:hypothetical protein n=1 Tax=Acinetobacter sp. RF14B TaxID=2650965 RepID=UPI00116E82E2|nr:hypothetical protein [Acinetobacter sp. RF14B]TQR66834.1 hypothetical protein E2K52_05450 [Acinetobacter sp. RF14B]
MSTKKYQVRIRKEVSEGEAYHAALATLGDGFTMSEIASMISNGDTSLPELIKKTSDALPDWEIISVILVDTDNSDQLGEDFEWNEGEA